MMANPRYCGNCGWQATPDARVCGNCGQALTPASGWDTWVPTTPLMPGQSAAPSDPNGVLYPSDAPTLYSPSAASAAGGYAAPPPYEPAYPPAPSVPAAPPLAAPYSAARPAARPRGCAARVGRAVFTLLLVLAILAGVGVGAWALFVRPAIHAQADGALRHGLNLVVDQAAAHIESLPSPPNGTYRIPGSLLNDTLQNKLPANAPVKDVQLRLANGYMSISYQIAGRPGSIKTQLYAEDGGVHARNTTVYGPLKLIESGSELQAALNDALTRLPPDLPITSVRAENDALYLTTES